MRACDSDQREHEDAVGDVAEEIAEPEADREQRPERHVAPALGIAGAAGTSEGEGCKRPAGEDVEPVDVNHRRRLSFRSISISRVPWIRNAQIAVGIAQTESWNGVSWIPKPASAP